MCKFEHRHEREHPTGRLTLSCRASIVVVAMNPIYEERMNQPCPFAVSGVRFLSYWW